MCAACQREYDDPGDRRFHAQPNACPACGPQLALWDGRAGAVEAKDDGARGRRRRSARRPDRGGQGPGRLPPDGGRRQRRGASHAARAQAARGEAVRPDVPARWRTCERVCYVSTAEARLLRSSEAPIVAAAPPRPHHRAAWSTRWRPAIPTSASCCPTRRCTTCCWTAVEPSRRGHQRQPLRRADLHRRARGARAPGGHRRPLPRPRPAHRPARGRLDRAGDGWAGSMVLRRARGYAPLPILVRGYELPSLLAVGGHLKNTVAVTSGRDVFVSQHIGDLETKPAHRGLLRRCSSSLAGLYRARPGHGGRDLHPDYVSTRYAEALGLPVVAVQHHLAHVAVVHGRERHRGPGARRVLGRHRLRPRRHDLGRRVPARHARRLHARGRASGPSACPAGSRPCASRGDRRWACSTRCAGDGVRSSHVLAEAFSQAERTLLVQMLQRGRACRR